jgi:hypothetical protein
MGRPSNNNDIIIQHDGLAMGAPSSGLIAEIFLQHMEHLHLTHLTHRHRIINYWRYVDDILLAFDPNHINIQAIVYDFSTIHPKLLFTAETERDNTLNYLDYPSPPTQNTPYRLYCLLISSQSPHGRENFHIQKTHLYRHPYPIHF